MSIIKITNEIYNSILETSFSREPKVDEKIGSYHLDCSSFFSLILKRLDHQAFNLLVQTRMKAKDFFEFFKSINEYGEFRVKRINTLEIKVGDVILWRKKNPPKSGDTGHIIIIKEVLSRESDRINVSVYDCTKLVHDNDSRKECGGVGFGEMQLLTDKQILRGYVWSSEVGKNKLTEMLVIRFNNKCIVESSLD